MEDVFLSWGAVYALICLPAVLMLGNFIFGQCFLGAELARQQQSTGTTRTRARVLGRGCIVLVMASFVWQYGVFMFTSREASHRRQCNVAFFLWDAVDALPAVWRGDYASVLVCTPVEVVYQATFLLFLVLYVMCVTSVPQVATPSAHSSDQEITNCSYCSRCAATVPVMDHHCYLIGNCVGVRNRWLFVMCLSSGVLNLAVLLWLRGAWALTEGGTFTVLGLVLVVCFAAFLVGLLCWQALLIRRGYTTLLFLKTARDRDCSKLTLLHALLFQSCEEAVNRKKAH